MRMAHKPFTGKDALRFVTRPNTCKLAGPADGNRDSNARMTQNESKPPIAMSHDQERFLSLPRYPAVVTLLEACWLLGLALHQGRILVGVGMLVPLGKRRHRKAKVFATAYILGLAQDLDWLAKAKDVISRHWEMNNAARKKKVRVAPQSNKLLTRAELLDLHQRVLERVQKMTPEQGFQSLVASGIYTPEGKLALEYGG